MRYECSSSQGHRHPWTCLFILFVVFSFSVSGCVDRSFAPETELQASLDILPYLDAVNHNPPVGNQITRVRAAVIRPPSEILDEVVVSVAPEQETATLRLEVPLQSPLETLQLLVELLADERPLFSGQKVVEVRASPAQNRVQTVTLSYVGPLPELAPGDLVFTADEGTDPSDQSVSLSNTGLGTLQWIASSDDEWVGTSPASGTLESGGTQTITVSLDSDGMPGGTHEASLVIADAMLGVADTVSIQFILNPKPSLGISPDSLLFVSFLGTSPGPQEISISNPGGGTLQWTATSEDPWIGVAPEAGSVESGQAAPVAIQVSSQDMASGTHRGSVFFSDPEAEASASLPVIYRIVERAEISLLPQSTILSTVEGDEPEPASFQISNPGGSPLHWTASSESPWVSVLPANGTLEAGQNDEITVAASAEGLSAGIYQATVTVEDPEASNSPQTFSLGLLVERRPEIFPSTGSIRFVTDLGVNPEPETLTLTNRGGGTLDWEATKNTDWLTVDPPSGSLGPGGTSVLSVSVDVTGLQPGDYADVIRVSDPAASNSPQNVSVQVTVLPGPAIGLSTGAVAFATRVDVAPPSRTELVRNTGGGTLKWQASVDAEWLSLSPESGEIPAGQGQALTLEIPEMTLEPGPYTATVTVQDPEASNSPQTIAVSLTVEEEPGPWIALSRSWMTFDTDKGENPPEQTFSFQNSGGETLSWEITTSAPWLNVEPTSGNLEAGQGAEVAVNPHAEDLDAGMYAESITIVDPGADNSPQTVSVSLLVRPGPAIGLSPGTLSFIAESGRDPEEGTFAIQNTGGGTLNWNAQEYFSCAPPDCPFGLEFDPAAGSLLSGQSESVTVWISSADTEPGDYPDAAWIEVTDPEASNSPQILELDLTIAEPKPPIISDIWYTLEGINHEACAYLEPPASLFTIHFTYSDPNGDVNQAQSSVKVEYGFIGGSSYEFSQPPEPGLTIAGDGISGQVSSQQCHRFGSSPGVALTHTLSDALGNLSNPLQITIPKPDGAFSPPGTPSRSGGSGGGIPEKQPNPR